MPAQAFPEGFSWGTATAAHQVDGGTWNNDWWAWEHNPSSPCVEPSGDAIDHWSRWQEDLKLLADLGFGAYRFSLEWSRIEPEEGEFSSAALDHYKAMCAGCRELGMEPVVTFHHFTSPRWVAAEGGWANPATAARFARFCARAASELGDLMGRACTINEPNVVAFFGYRGGVFPPGERSSERRQQANHVFIEGHRRAVDAIRAAAPGVPVGLTLSMTDYQALEGGEAQLEHLREPMEDVFLHATEGDDFLGVQVYTRMLVGPDGPAAYPPGARTTLMGYEFYPEALEACLRRAWAVTGGAVPLLVTENGIGTADDAERIEYVERALQGVLRGLADGLDIRGYTYWSAFDNFEWAFGYRPTFGLVAVDRSTFVRTPKPSASWLGEIATRNAL
ncbi:MAG: glycoside hydrolase family 1 protein [Acidimicrobiia bacterium]|nr:glycoside hydrolase family 1 protein [Acidimicrobiia bacterium]